MWFLYSLFFALWSAISIFITKNLTKTFQPLPLLYTVFLFYLPCTFITMLLTGGIPHASGSFYLFMLISAIMDAAAFNFSFRAISLSPISLVAPIQSFAPIITTLTAILALGETPTFLKFTGILFTVVGAYLLNASDVKKGILSPIKNLAQDKGTQLSFAATVLWGFTPIFQKKALFEISPRVPLYASFVGIFLVTLILTPFAFKNTWKHRGKIPMNLKWFFLCGAGGALAQLAAYNAFSIINVGYASAVFKTSTFFVVLLGGLFLKEKRFRERMAASLVMFLGVLFLVT